MEKRDFEQGVPHDDWEGGTGESRHDSERPPAVVLDCWTQRCRDSSPSSPEEVLDSLACVFGKGEERLRC